MQRIGARPVSCEPLSWIIVLCLVGHFPSSIYNFPQEWEPAVIVRAVVKPPQPQVDPYSLPYNAAGLLAALLFPQIFNFQAQVSILLESKSQGPAKLIVAFTVSGVFVFVPRAALVIWFPV